MAHTDDDLDGTNRTIPYDDGTFVRMAIYRTSDATYPSGWHYALHYGARNPNAVDVPTLEDGTIRRYDNAHEDTKGHELHLASDPDPDTITFPGMVELYERFWSEIPKARVDP